MLQCINELTHKKKTDLQLYFFFSCLFSLKIVQFHCSLLFLKIQMGVGVRGRGCTQVAFPPFPETICRFLIYCMFCLCNGRTFYTFAVLFHGFRGVSGRIHCYKHRLYVWQLFIRIYRKVTKYFLLETYHDIKTLS